jgi:molybdopterin-guanine dinucleotide biosynthesis protein A
MTGFDAVILAGGGSRRMGGGDKTTLLVGGVSLLDRALEAACGAGRIVVVGAERPTARSVHWAREDPPGGGPAAALAAGLQHVSAPLVLVLAADLPFVSAAVAQTLLHQAHPRGAVLTDDSGAAQWLLGAWPAAALRSAFSGDQHGRSLRATLAPLDPVFLTAGEGLPAWFDCDEPADVSAAKELIDERAGRLAR